MIYNFSAGPAVLPMSVLNKAQQAVVDWEGTGTSIMSISHRSPEFITMAEQMKANLRDLMAIPDDYEIFFLHGGASWQSAMIPANFVGEGQVANYVQTGYWSQKSIKESELLYPTHVIASGVEAALNTNWPMDDNAAYCHFTPNETIDGVEFYDFPKTDVPLIADMSSTILSRPFDISQLDMVYAGAQKNIGPSGMTIAIVKHAFLEKSSHRDLPSMMHYHTHRDAKDAMANTPPTFAWYVASEVFKWLKAEGGVREMAKRNQAKSQMLYDAIDGSDFYANTIPEQCRSWMNVPFQLADPSQDERFIAEAKAAGLINIKGHRSVGGMRVSLYNAMPIEGVEALVGFMSDFEF